MWGHVIAETPFASRYTSDQPELCSGKWLVTFPHGDPEDLWERLVGAAVRGELRAVKKSGPRLDGVAGHHIACVYCEISTPDHVAQTLCVLRDLGISGPLRYKSDRATVDGVDEYLWTSDVFERPADESTPTL